MIYMVDHVYTDPTTEQGWHDWYAGYLRKLVAVPGIHTAQRFKAVGVTPSQRVEYLAYLDETINYLKGAKIEAAKPPE